MVRFVYIVACVAGLCLYGGNAFFGYEYFSSGERVELPSSVRQSPGGYRTFFFYHSGYRGGK